MTMIDFRSMRRSVLGLSSRGASDSSAGHGVQDLALPYLEAIRIARAAESIPDIHSVNNEGMG